MSDQVPANVWVDTDMGVDDIHALLYLRHAGVMPVAQSLSFGCASLTQVSHNAAGFSRVFRWNRPWHRGAAQSFRGETRTAAHVLGTSGLPTRSACLPQTAQLPSTASAIDALMSWLSDHPPHAQVLALGPLSNIANLCLQAPELAQRIHRLTWMGGATARGNQTAHAEFNAWADAQAAAVVFASGIPVRMVDLEACRQVQLRPEDLRPLSRVRNAAGRLLHDLLGGYLDIGLSRGRPGMAIYDPVAAAALVSPEDFDSRKVSIDVISDTGEHEGQTVLRQHPSAERYHEIVTVRNPDALKTRLLEALLAATEPPQAGRPDGD
ncbi:nucleoside hydrolase [Granulosicoccus sp. 3-233]|uniref:nucleoside hydrolase n=1 Tax=Granulosicoccus sp. 3-233 TaxID=3417969 RepID=UPI003D32EC53